MSHSPNNLDELRPFLTAAAISQTPDGQPVHGLLGSFPILDWLGSGGMGFVCKAWEADLQRTVALKVMKPHFAGDRVVPWSVVTPSRNRAWRP